MTRFATGSIAAWFMGIVAVAAVPRPGVAGSDPHLPWFTIETAHFRIHYPEPLEELAQRTAVAAEDAHSVLSERLGWQPLGRTEVLLHDFQDGANGFADVRPYARMTLLAHPPPAASALSHHGDYWRLLVFHEYTHVLHLDQVSGLPALANHVFGRAFLPNQGLPTWFIEGLAVWAETQFTAGGRNVGGFFEMYLRTAADEGEFLDLARATGVPKWPPRGEMLYAHGGAFVAWLIERHGEAALRAFLAQYGSRIVSYGLNTAARMAFGASFEELHEAFAAQWRARATQWRERAERDGVVAGERMTRGGENHSSLRASAGGRYLAYVHGSGRDPTEIRVRDVVDGTDWGIQTCWGGCTAAGWSPDASRLFVGRPTWTRWYYRYHDLFEIDAATGAARQLSSGHRVQSPAMSPDGQTLAYTVSDAGRVHLAALDLASGEERLLVPSGETYRQPADPQWSPDGQWLVFSMSAEGSRDIWLYDVAAQVASPLMRDRALDVSPTWSPDGRWVIFASDREDTFDVWAIDLQSAGPQRPLYRISRVLGGALDPAVARDGLWYRGWTTRGWDLWRLPFAPEAWTPMGSIGPDDGLAGPREVLVAPAAAEALPREEYDALSTLLPRAWLPDVRIVSDGTFTAGVSLSATDIAAFHRWHVDTEWSTAISVPTVAFGYSLERMVPSLRSEFFWYRTSAVGSADYDTFDVSRDVFTGGFTASIPFDDDWKSHSLTARLDAILSFVGDSEPYVLDPTTIPPRVPADGTRISTALSWRHSSSRSFAWSISREQGRELGLTFSLESRVFGSDTSAWTLRWDWSEYVSLGKSHVLALRYDGGVSGTPAGRGRAFRLGGVPSRPLLDDILQRRGLGSGLLRGYRPAAYAGDLLQLLNAEWRFPLAYVHRGVGTLPLFLERLHGTVFCDVGTATYDPLLGAEWRVGVGVELRADLDVFFGSAMSLRLGVAHGLAGDGETSLYFVSGRGF